MIWQCVYLSTNSNRTAATPTKENAAVLFSTKYVIIRDYSLYWIKFIYKYAHCDMQIFKIHHFNKNTFLKFLYYFFKRDG